MEQNHATSVEIVSAATEGAVTAGGNVVYQATAQDAQGKTWDVTAITTFSIEAGAGGFWTGNAYTSENPGDWTVTAQHDGLVDTTVLHVVAAAQAPEPIFLSLIFKSD